MKVTHRVRVCPPHSVGSLRSAGVAITVESVSARDFAAAFVEAARRNAAPDVIVTDNIGTIKGITVRGERFIGIGEDPAVKKDLIQVTGAFDELLGPRRGWIYLYAGSANYHVGRDWALTAFECAKGTSGPPRGRHSPPSCRRLYAHTWNTYRPTIDWIGRGSKLPTGRLLSLGRKT